MKLDLETELLTLCARNTRTPDTEDRIRDILRREVDWSYLLGLAYRHGVRPLLYQSLADLDFVDVPTAIRAQLRTFYAMNAGRNLRLTGQLKKLLGVFEEHGIAATPYKGPLLAQIAYGNLALREFGDIDILIRQQQVAAAWQILREEGFQPRDDLNPTQEWLRIHSRRSRRFVKVDQAAGIHVDVQWGVTLLKQFAFPTEDDAFWANLEQVDMMNAPVKTMRKSDLLQVLCIHGSRHFWEKLKWVCDVAELLRSHPDWDWKTTLDRARALGNQRILFLGVHLATELLGVRTPEWVLSQIRADEKVSELSRYVIANWLFPASRNDSGSSPGVRGYLIHVRERPLDRAWLYGYYCLWVPLRVLATQPASGWRRLLQGAFHRGNA